MIFRNTQGIIWRRNFSRRASRQGAKTLSEVFGDQFLYSVNFTGIKKSDIMIKMKKIFLTVFVLTILLLTVFACKKQTQTPVPLSGGDFEMDGETLVKYRGNARNIIIPEDVTVIGENAFSDKGMISVTIPSSVTSIRVGAFSGCKGLTSIAIPSSVTSIREMTFYESGLTNIIIPSSVISIGRSAFERCDLTSVTIPSSVISIGEQAFYLCTNLTSVTIPKSVTSIESEAFALCHSLRTIVVSKGTRIGKGAFPNNAQITYSDDFEMDGTVLVKYHGDAENVIIPDGVTSIGDGAFYRPGDGPFTGLSSLISVTIPEGVKSIGNGAFWGALNLTSVTIPSSVTSIGEQAFYYCTDLRRVTIPSSVISIGKEAFAGCSSLTSIDIPSSVTSIGEEAFWMCDNLRIVAISRKTTIGENVFPENVRITYSD
jgi:hypothetical protein